ncbi:MAG: hypothetical protein K1X75_06345 [Leptospirales bacterium]|nr:hypothetical protein [Leptospirales bacterium]
MDFKIARMIALAAGLIAAAPWPLLAYEEEWNDPKFADPAPAVEEPGGAEQLFRDSRFRLDGVVWAGYEFLDYQANGASDSSGPNSEKAGFRVGRAYVNARGEAVRGPYQGFGFRVTFDAAPAAGFGDGCSADGNSACTGANTSLAFLKYAYMNVPLYAGGRLFLRFGQQETPLIDAPNGISLQEIWDYRYLDSDGKPMYEELGLGSSTDRGLSINFKHDYLGISALLGNGESYTRVNAQQIRRQSLSDLARGEGDSYGLDFYGAVSLRPTGKDRDLELTLTLPFRLRNITGIAPEETSFASVDLSNPAAPQASYLIGDERAKKDAAYGYEADGVIRSGDLSFTAGLGQAVRVDRRGRAFSYNQTTLANGIDPNNQTQVLNSISVEEDAYGVASYFFAHARYEWLGAFFRYSEGNSDSALNGALGVSTRKSWLSQMINADRADGVLGNLSFGETRSLDLGRSRFRKITYGLTWHANDRFRLSIGLSRITGTTASGGERRVNALQRVSGQGAASSLNLAQQLENSASFKSQLGLSSNDRVDLNDFIGQRQVEQQIFVRSQYLF